MRNRSRKGKGRKPGAGKEAGRVEEGTVGGAAGAS